MHFSIRKFAFRIIALMLVVIVVVSIGTVIFYHLEDWSLVESAYFATATLTTVGYGDVTPTNDVTRMVAIVYMLLTVPMFFLMIGLVGEVVFYKYSHIHHRVRAKRKQPRKRSRK